MQRTILIKQAFDWQMGHLYEHLYCDALDDFLLEQGFLASLDYHLIGRTFSNGVIEISVIGFNQRVNEHIGNFSKLKVDLSKTSLAIKQIMAEKSVVILTDIALIKEQLKQLDNLKWLPISEVKALIGGDDHDFLQLQPDDNIAKELMISLTIENSDLSPMFPFLANVIKVNLANFIIKTCGGFYDDDDWDYDDERCIELCRILITKDIDLNMAIVQQHFREIIEKMQQKIPQIVDFFATADYAVPLSAPNEVEVADKTGVFVGEAGWKELAVAENIEAILKSIVLSVN